MRLILYPFSLLYGLVILIRNLLYDIGILGSARFDIPVILVGNLSTGGTGKTPHVEYLIRLLKARYKVATLSRGYGRETRGFREATIHCSVTDVGDEPLLYKTRHPEIIVTVCENRAEGIRTILKMHPEVQVILMDDGFQHRAVRPGFSILLTPFRKPWNRDHLLPAGNLREQVSGRKRAACAVVTGTPPQLSTNDLQPVADALRMPAQKPVFFSSVAYGELLKVFDDAPAFAPPAKVVLFAGIAHAGAFEQKVKELYGDVVSVFYGDHHVYTEEEITDLAEKFREWDMLSGKAVLMTTEKDAMRLRTAAHASLLHGLPLYYLPINVVLRTHLNASFDAMILQYVEQNQRNG